MIKMTPERIKILQDEIADQIYKAMPDIIKKYQVDLLEVTDLELGFKVTFNMMIKVGTDA